MCFHAYFKVPNNTSGATAYLTPEGVTVDRHPHVEIKQAAPSLLGSSEPLREAALPSYV